MQWTQVHAGPIWQVELYQGRMDAEGIATFIPDASTKTVDPFATGGTPLMADLYVEADRADEARAILASFQEEAASPDEADEDWDDDDDTDEDESNEKESTPEEEVERFATRTRWAACLWITFPYALATGANYLRVSKRYGIRSTNHGLTIAALVFAVLNLATLLTMVAVSALGSVGGALT